MNAKEFAALAFIIATWFLASPARAYVKDPYKVLGVEKRADDAAIKKAYKKLALKYHPDKNPKGQAKFIEIQQAYEILTDEDKKREYDLGGGAGGDYRHHQHQGSARQQYHHHQYHFYQQQQQHYHFYQQQQQQQEQMYERALPSNTSFLTASNFRSHVIHSGRPWFIMIYTEGSQACRDFAGTWEALWKSLGGSQPGGGNRDGASVGLGRVHARFQRNLMQLILKGLGPFPGGLAESDLPLLVAVPNGCLETNCFVRYRGPLRLSALKDYVADHLLHLPRVPQLEPQSVVAFLRRASPYKVVVVAFGRAGGGGSLALRALAARQKDMLTLARGHVREGDAASGAAWQAALGLSSPPAAGQVVFLRGPGSAPRTLEVPPGKAGELQQQIEEQGLLWQSVPPLRSATGASLGCLWGRPAAASGRSMIDTCVLAVACRGPQLEEARRRMALLGRHLALASARRDPSMSSAASAYMDGKLRLVWLDASVQRPLCAWLMGLPGAMRPTNTAPPPGTNAAGRAAAVAQAMAAAAARSPELAHAVCGPAPLDLLGRARDAAAAAAAAAGLPRLAAQLQPRDAAAVVVFRPSSDGSSWFRGGSSHMRHGRPVFLHAVNADFDLAVPERGLDVELPKLAAWINTMHHDPERHLHASAAFPPALRPDDEQGALEFVAGRVYEGAMLVLRFVMNAGSVDGSAPLRGELQVANLAVTLLALVLVQLAFLRMPNGHAARARAAADDAATAARGAAGGSSADVHPSEGRGSRDRRGEGAVEGAEGDGDSGSNESDGRAGFAGQGRVARKASGGGGSGSDIGGSDGEGAAGEDTGLPAGRRSLQVRQTGLTPDSGDVGSDGCGESAPRSGPDSDGSSGQRRHDRGDASGEGKGECVACSGTDGESSGLGGSSRGGGEGSAKNTVTVASTIHHAHSTDSGGDGGGAAAAGAGAASSGACGTGLAIGRHDSGRGGTNGGGGGGARTAAEEGEGGDPGAEEVGDGWLSVTSPRHTAT